MLGAEESAEVRGSCCHRAGVLVETDSKPAPMYGENCGGEDCQGENRQVMGQPGHLAASVIRRPL